MANKVEIIIDAIDNASGVLSGIGNTMRDIGQGLTNTFTQPFIKAFLAAAKESEAFDDSMKSLSDDLIPVFDELFAALNEIISDPEIRAALVEIATIMSELLVTSVREGVPLLLEMVRGFKEMSPEVKEGAVQLVLLLAALGPILTTFGTFLISLIALKPVLIAVVSLIGAVSIPVLALIAAIGLLIGIIVVFGKKAWNTITMIAGITKVGFGNMLDAYKKIYDYIKDKLIGAFTGVKDAVKDLIGWISDLATKLLNLDVSKIFKPGSPTPFEIGLRGIGGAMKNLNTSQIPSLQSNLMGMQAPAMAAVPGGGGIINVSLVYNPTISLADKNEAENRLLPFIRDALRKA